MTTRERILIVLILLAVVAPLVATPPIVSAYGADYSGTVQVLKDILAELRLMRADVQRLHPGFGGAPGDGTVLFKAKCAKCHTEGSESGEFVTHTADGKEWDISVQERAVAAYLVKNGRMPKAPEPKLTDQEKEALFKYLSPVSDDKKQVSK